MPSKSGIPEYLVQLIDRIGGPCGPGDPLQRFRRRAFTVMMLILALVCFAQVLAAWMGHPSLMFMAMGGTVCVLLLVGLFISRRLRQIETLACVLLSLVMGLGALLEIIWSRSPNTPMIHWGPVVIFGGYVLCGLRRGTVVALVSIISTLAVVGMPFVLNDVHMLPGEGRAEPFQQRLFISVLLCHLLPLLVLGSYEKLMVLCHGEARDLVDRMEGRRDWTFLGRLAQVLVGEMEPQLKELEKAWHELPRRKDVLQAADEVLQPLQRIVHVARRYEPLSVGVLAAAGEGLALQEFPEILKRFTDFPAIRLIGAPGPYFRVQGGQAFYLLIFLSMSLWELIENPRVQLQGVDLQLQRERLEIRIDLNMSDHEGGLSLAQEFLHDVDANVRLIATKKGPSTHRLEMDVPLVRV
ncbi:hypothetical protein [Oligoflexus tunisiensis]|uniref:hypothetical protein n=1 Tax=Oligoflexus tunisiensis TaxID=708132 RepID=UPI00114D15D1|nr:hypothetical protein [Oligoflexus tunisiensis]